ncbi:hypothetical protein ACFQ0B_80090 [Nonomuraea thailandensis]
MRLAAEAITQAGGTGSAGVLAALEMMDGFQLFSGPLKFTLEHTLANGDSRFSSSRTGPSPCRTP